MRLLVITQKVDKNDSILGFFHGWLAGFANHTEKLTVICLEEGAHNLPSNTQVLSLGKERGVSKFGYLYNFFRFITKKRKDYDAVFVHMNPIYVVLGGLFWKVWGKTVALWYTHKSVNLKLRIAEKCADVIFSASETSFRLESEEVRYVGHGIDTELFAPHAEEGNEELDILSVGRISPVKDYETLLSAARMLKNESDIDFTLTVVGGPVTEEDEAYLATLLEKVDEWELKEKVVFAGSVSQEEVVAFYQDADVFVNMSKTGSLDKAVLEAMATGAYPLTSNEAFKDVFEEKADRYMFRTGDARGLARKLQSVAVGGSAERRLQELRETVVKDHSVKALIPRLIQYINEIEN